MSATKPTSDVKTWTFGGLTRYSENGKFDSSALANILQNATEASASAFKARGIPEAMRVVELMGIEQARRWGACTVCRSVLVTWTVLDGSYCYRSTSSEHSWD